MAGVFLIAITAVVILIGTLVCCKRKVNNTDTPKEHQYDYVTTSKTEEVVYDYVSTLSADRLYPVPSIKTSPNAAYGKFIHS